MKSYSWWKKGEIKVKNRVLAMLVCLSMVFGLCACGADTGTDPADTTSKKERAASVENGTLSADSTTIAVGKTTVLYREYQAYNYLMKSQYDGILDESVWDYTTGGVENSIGQEAVLDVVRLIIQIKVICKEAALQGITLAADEKEEADHNSKDYCDSLSDEIKEANGISEPVVNQIFEENKLAEKMYSVVTGKVDVNVTKDQAKAVRVQLIYLSTEGKQKEEVKKRADELCAQTKNLSGNFYKFANENTEADEVEYVIGMMDSRENLAGNVVKMKQGDISGVIEESDGYYIACCVQASGDALAKQYRNQVVEERQVKAFRDSYAGWSKNYNVRVSKSLLIHG